MEIVTGVLFNLLIAGVLLALVATPFLCSICFACKLDKNRNNPAM
ncbi:MAG: hypothetical protein ACC653_01965 [Gammaproteobacteria bacterium]